MPINAIQTWNSGDWKKKPALQKPHNGIEISITPLYDPETNNLLSATVLVTDYT
jgi:hypothetical protein